MTTLSIPPIFVTFRDLCAAMESLHQGDKAHLDRLHDLWRLGAPSPESIVRDPAHFDEREVQPENLVKRLILPAKLAAWIQDVSAVRGFPYSERQSLNLVFGQVDYGF